MPASQRLAEAEPALAVHRGAAGLLVTSDAQIVSGANVRNVTSGPSCRTTQWAALRTKASTAGAALRSAARDARLGAASFTHAGRAAAQAHVETGSCRPHTHPSREGKKERTPVSRRALRGHSMGHSPFLCLHAPAPV
jgi:hypothetical protein